MTESKIERVIREVSFAAQCAEMALQGVKAAPSGPWQSLGSAARNHLP